MFKSNRRTARLLVHPLIKSGLGLVVRWPLAASFPTIEQTVRMGGGDYNIIHVVYVNYVNAL